MEGNGKNVETWISFPSSLNSIYLSRFHFFFVLKAMAPRSINKMIMKMASLIPNLIIRNTAHLPLPAPFDWCNFLEIK